MKPGQSLLYSTTELYDTTVLYDIKNKETS